MHCGCYLLGFKRPIFLSYRVVIMSYENLLGLVSCFYVLFAFWVYRDFMKVFETYKVCRRNGTWIVRDSKGRFVIITKSFWRMVTLGASL